MTKEALIFLTIVI